MKQIITFLSILITFPLLYAQEIDIAAIPSAVMDKFTLLYPDAKSISWKITEEKYKAEFKNDKMSTMALMASDGSLLQTETQIKITALPEPALAYLLDKFEDKKIGPATIIENKAGIITFEAVADKVDYTFDASGQVMDMNELAVDSRYKVE